MGIFDTGNFPLDSPQIDDAFLSELYPKRGLATGNGVIERIFLSD